MSNYSEHGSVTRLPSPSDENAVIRRAFEILETRGSLSEWYVQQAGDVKGYLWVRLLD